MEFKTLKSFTVHLQSLVDAKLWVKVIVALVLGIIIGVVLSPNTGWIAQNISVVIGNWLALPGKLFLKMVQMIMIPLIFASIISGIVSNTGEQLKKLGIGVGIYFIITTVVSIVIGVFLVVLINPGKYFYQSVTTATQPIGNNTIKGEFIFEDLPNTISELLPGNPLASMVSGEMLAIVIFTVIIGIAITQLENKQKEPVMRMLSSIQEICMTVVKWAMRLVPFAVFGLIAQITSTIGFNSLKGIGLYMATVLIGLILLLLIYLIVVKIVSGYSPFTFLKKIRDVQLLAFSTTSSAAVMPLSIKTAQEELGVSKSISNFLIPIGATINMDGTALYQCVSIFFIAQAYGLETSIASIILIMITVIAASIGTPAIPGGGVIILATVLQGTGIPTEGIVLIIGVERILGMFRTIINVTGDLTACLVFNRMEQKWDRTPLTINLSSVKKVI
jgi:Na+/H+-dicarboxylate symporter